MKKRKIEKDLTVQIEIPPQIKSNNNTGRKFEAKN